MWRTIASETIIEDYHVTLKKNKVQLQDGAVIDDFFTVTIPDAAIVAAITSEGKIILKSEFRYACNTDVIECPAGMFEKDETDPLLVAKRELKEETGFDSNDWTFLGSTFESTSKLTNKMYLFLAKDCVKVSNQNLDATEHLTVMEVPLNTAVDMVMNGSINANSTAHLILKVARILTTQTGRRNGL